jgi:hypothetical protein
MNKLNSDEDSTYVQLHAKTCAALRAKTGSLLNQSERAPPVPRMSRGGFV